MVSKDGSWKQVRNGTFPLSICKRHRSEYLAVPGLSGLLSFLRRSPDSIVPHSDTSAIGSKSRWKAFHSGPTRGSADSSAAAEVHVRHHVHDLPLPSRQGMPQHRCRANRHKTHTMGFLRHRRQSNHSVGSRHLDLQPRSCHTHHHHLHYRKSRGRSTPIFRPTCKKQKSYGI